jgi:hypothetical protein
MIENPIFSTVSRPSTKQKDLQEPNDRSWETCDWLYSNWQKLFEIRKTSYIIYCIKCFHRIWIPEKEKENLLTTLDQLINITTSINQHIR